MDKIPSCDIEVLNKTSIAVVGSRRCTTYGKKWCEEFVKELLEYDLVITSGLAYGIDTIAHKTALKYGGQTIAVLPSGLDNVYPKENINLYRSILKNGGAVISEYPPNESQNRDRFLDRNRIVSGLAIGTLVIEAAYHSGTSVTARFTKESGKEVFCIPGNLDNSKSQGTNNLIKKGAKLVTSAQDIAECYDFLYKRKKIILDKTLDLDDVNDEYKPIYKHITNIPIDINDISRLSGINISEIMSKVTMLEIDGKIKNVGGNKFVRC